MLWLVVVLLVVIVALLVHLVMAIQAEAQLTRESLAAIHDAITQRSIDQLAEKLAGDAIE